MSYFHYDSDEWETVSTYRPCTACGGDLRRCNGACNGSGGIELRPRSFEDVARIKAEKRHQYEESVLAEAAAIRLRGTI